VIQKDFTTSKSYSFIVPAFVCVKAMVLAEWAMPGFRSGHKTYFQKLPLRFLLSWLVVFIAGSAHYVTVK
jgi:hypothetical protein